MVSICLIKIAYFRFLVLLLYFLEQVLSLMLEEFLFWNAGASFLNDQSSSIKWNFIMIIIKAVWALVREVLRQHL